MSFGKKLMLLRTTHNLNQNEMSQRLNVSQPVYSRYENGEKEVKENDDFVKRVAEEFDVTRKWLFADDSNLSFAGNENLNNDITGFLKLDRCYNLPKDFMDAYFKQQHQMLETILSKLGGK